MAKRKTGITERRSNDGTVKYRAEAYDNATQRRIYKTFPLQKDAVAWRNEMQGRIARGEARAVEAKLISDAWALWIAAARSAVVRSRGGSPYKPGVLRSYELCWEGRLKQRFGHVKVAELRRVAIQRFIDELIAEGLAAQTVRNVVNTLRVLMKWCVREELRLDNPCDGVELPSGGTARDRITPPSGALDLLAPLSTEDKAILATAFFAGLRRGEEMALRACCVDLVARTVTIDAERGSYDPRTRTFGPPKSKKGARTLGIPELLVPYLAALDATGEELMFARETGEPFSDTALRDRCMAAWGWTFVRKADGGEWVKTRDDALEPTGLHEARHTYASLMIAAGVNIKTISEWMGHSSVTITLDRYGHLLPGSAQAALGLLNDYLAQELS